MLCALVFAKILNIHFCPSWNCIHLLCSEKAAPPDVRLFFGLKKVKETKDSKLKRAGVTAYNKPKATPNHPTKSHVVVAKVGDKTKTIRFGQQGADTKPPRRGESAADKAKRKSFKARHAKNIAKGRMSAAYWADRTKWS